MLIILVVISMVGKPQLTDWVQAVISYNKEPSLEIMIDVFFTSSTLLYNMVLGGYATWAFLTYTRIRGSQHDNTGRRSGQQTDAPRDMKGAAS
jgi:hypothetical protein